MIQGFDMDGVLAEGPPQGKIPWRHMKGHQRKEHLDQLLYFYLKARPLLVPRGTFCVISARKSTPEIMKITGDWIQQRYPGQLTGLYLLSESRSLENVIAFKSARIRSLGLTDFTEDNPKIVAGLRKLDLNCRIWLYRNGQSLLDYKA